MQRRRRKYRYPTCCLLQVCVLFLTKLTLDYSSHFGTSHRNCFQPLISAKFRKTLEPHINLQADGPRRSALKPAGDLLVGLSGSLGSTVLLDLVHRTYLAPRGATDEYGGKSHPRKDKVWKKIRVCYVELCDAFPGVSHSPCTAYEVRLQHVCDCRWKTEQRWSEVQSNDMKALNSSHYESKTLSILLGG